MRHSFRGKVPLLFSCQLCPCCSAVAIVVRAELHSIDEEAVRAEDGQARRHRIQQVRDAPVVLPPDVDRADFPLESVQQSGSQFAFWHFDLQIEMQIGAQMRRTGIPHLKPILKKIED